MGIIKLTTTIKAPQERCFDLARSIDLHTKSAAKSSEQAIAGVTSGLIDVDQEVTWRARHLGITFTLTSRIVELRKPEYFKDVMTRGPFKVMEHEHHFEPSLDGTIMYDIFYFHSPLGFIGTIVDRFFLNKYLKVFLFERNNYIKQIAESNAWMNFVP